MSSRVLKKLQGDSDLSIPAVAGDVSDENDDDLSIGGVGASGCKFNANRYDLFNDESVSESEVKEDDNETEHASAKSPQPIEQAKKKKKKRKKKTEKKKTGAGAGMRRSSEDKSDTDEIFRTLREVDRMFGTSRSSTGPQVTPVSNTNALRTLLIVQHKNLNQANEMKRMFGSRVVQGDQTKRRNTRGSRPMRSTWLVTAKENWPPVSKVGLYMSVEPASDEPQNRHLVWFRFEHTAGYHALQKRFLSAVDSLDSDNIIQVINQQPYHVDSLIQLSELCKMSDDTAMAADLIEHALLSLETSFHSLFSLTSGNCRLDYRRQENRGLFVVLFKHAQYLEGRACPRTALEVSKLIMSFDPDNDPLAMILCLDFYALRSQQYDWLTQLYEQGREGNSNLSQLPNMAFSYAMALFYLERTESADAALQYALMMFPGVLKPLLSELGVQTDARANTHAFFGPLAYAAQRPALQQLVALYTVRTQILWQDRRLLGWMERNVNAVLDRVDARDPIVAEYERKRAQRYPKTPRAILRHIVLSDYKEKVPLEPFINKDSEPILMYDPLPPLDSINTYVRPTGAARRTLSDASPFSMFFQSLMPTFNALQQLQQAPVPPADNGELVEAVDAAVEAVVAGEAADAAAGFGNAAERAPADPNNVHSLLEIRNSLSTIVDSMRDFLLHMRGSDAPANDTDVPANESTDAEDGPNDSLT